MSKKNLSVADQLRSLENTQELLEIKKYQLINKAMHGSNPNDLLKAKNVLENIDQKKNVEHKAFYFDPNNWNNFQGYKEKPYAITYDTLRRISYAVPIIRAIINTRINQVCDFCIPRENNYDTGFIIRKKKKWFTKTDKSKLITKQEEEKIHIITEAVMNGSVRNGYDNDDFDSFTRKVLNDSLTFDQLCFENRFDNLGRWYDRSAVDGTTIRYANSVDTENYDPRIEQVRYQKINGYLPETCQIYNNVVQNAFYPWEMCMGVRNPTTSIFSCGYGISELEMLINTITSILWAEEYNRKFFSQGSAPKGILNIKGENINTNVVNQFKQQWRSMMTGVGNSHKTPVLTGDVNWIDLQKVNREMEFSNWMEFLIKCGCAVFSIDPAEINFPLSGGAEQKAMFEGNNEARLKHSRDKGLLPLLRFYERKLNKYIIQPIDPEYELVFSGVNGDDPDTDLDRDVKRVSSIATIDEIRIQNGETPLGEENGGNIIENSFWMQWYQNKQMHEMQEQAMMQGGGENDESDNDYEEVQKSIVDKDPIHEAFNKYFEKLNHKN